VVLTTVLAMASALTATTDLTAHDMANTICETFFGPSAYGYADAKDEYAQALQALDKSADDLADMRSDVAAQFPSIAFHLGSWMASADLGSGDKGPTPSRAGSRSRSRASPR